MPSLNPDWKTALRGQRPIINRGIIAETGVIPAGLQLIRDSNPWQVINTKKAIKEYKDLKTGKMHEEPVMKVTGLFQVADIQNANGRIYPYSIIDEAVKAIMPDCAQRSVFGEYDHPPDAKIHLDRLSHGVTKIWMDGKKVYGEAEIMDNQPYGRCLRGLFESKWRMGISSRGVGDMELQEISEGKQAYFVQPGYRFVTWDAVAEPSVSGAILTPMSPIGESVNRVTKHINEERKRGKLFSKTDYENMLLEEVNKIFGLRDFGPRRR